MTCWGLGHTFTWGGSASSDVPPLSLRCQCGLLCRGDLPADATLAEVEGLKAENEELRAEQEDDRRTWGRDSVAWELAVEGLKEENKRLTDDLAFQSKNAADVRRSLMLDRCMRAQVEQSQAEGHYSVALSRDGFSSSYTFWGTPAEIRVVLADIERQLAECETQRAEAMVASAAAHLAAAEQLRHCDRRPRGRPLPYPLDDIDPS